MNKHTPSPWKTQPVTGNVSFAHRIFADRREIAMVWHHPGQRPKQATGEQEQADANLLAAALDLLEAAKHAAMEWRLHGQLTDSCRVLEAAIKKAERMGGK